jgi:hypothetical protein
MTETGILSRSPKVLSHLVTFSFQVPRIRNASIVHSGLSRWPQGEILNTALLRGEELRI